MIDDDDSVSEIAENTWAAVQGLTEDDFQFSVDDPGGGPSWDVYYATDSTGVTGTLAVRIVGRDDSKGLETVMCGRGCKSEDDVLATIFRLTPHHGTA